MYKEKSVWDTEMSVLKWNIYLCMFSILFFFFHLLINFICLNCVFLIHNSRENYLILKWVYQLILFFQYLCMLNSQTNASECWDTINYLILTILKDSIHSSLSVWKSAISRFTDINYDDISISRGFLIVIRQDMQF